MTLRIYLLCSVAFLAFSQQAKAANGSVNITGNKTSIYIATDNASGSSIVIVRLLMSITILLNGGLT